MSDLSKLTVSELNYKISALNDTYNRLNNEKALINQQIAETDTEYDAIYNELTTRVNIAYEAGNS